MPLNDIFYLRQLWVYVFGVQNCASSNASMYVWPEIVARCGSNEVVCCLHRYLRTVWTQWCYSQIPVGDKIKSQPSFTIYTHWLRQGRFITYNTFAPFEVTLFYHVTEILWKPNQRWNGWIACTLQKHWMDVIRVTRKSKPFTVPTKNSVVR